VAHTSFYVDTGLGFSNYHSFSHSYIHFPGDPMGTKRVRGPLDLSTLATKSRVYGSGGEGGGEWSRRVNGEDYLRVGELITPELD
jgi:hypothetical protein